MMQGEKRRAWLALALLLLIFTAGCVAPEQYRRVRLSTGERGEVIVPPAGQKVPLRVAVAPVISPRESFKLYAALFDYISRQIDRPVEIVQRRTYGEVNDLVRYGGADVAFVCDYAYVEGEKTFGMQLLVAPVVMGQNRYQSYIIVPKESYAQSLDDLRGKAFAFSDPLSNSGWLFPTHLLRKIGETPESFFKRFIFTYSHDNTVKAVAEKLVDGGAVDSLVYDFIVAREPRYGEKIRVIQASEPWGTPPVVVHPGIDPNLREKLRQVLLTVHENEAGRRALAPLAIDRFILPDDRFYDDVRRMAALVRERQ
ncbi:MAG: phosphate/phosphite/phosphonate ABC transporter substrate-binding protein [Chloroflexi bacterium]|nr:phosphate/phosphite/phosphonate ABC transporter substrate-binding protein [Chloroflexota bacterium]